MQYTITIFLLGLMINVNLSYAKALLGKHANATNIQYLQNFPFVVSIATRDETFENKFLHECTGSLLTSKLVLTAGHCFNNMDKRNRDNERNFHHDVQVFVGSNDLRKVKTYEVQTWIIYCEWFLRKSHANIHKFCDEKSNDIAILELTEDVVNIRPARLSYTKKEVLVDSTVSTVGWGANHLPIDELKIAFFKVISDSRCESRLREIGADAIVTPQYICSIAEPEWTVLEEGDSGGPLLNKDFAIVGINKGVIPKEYDRNLVNEIIHHYESNSHMSVYEYQGFIEDIKRIGVSKFLKTHKLCI